MPQRSPEDGEINWNWSAQNIYNFIRAQTKPYPGAFTYLKKEKIIIWKSSLIHDLTNAQANAGEILSSINNNPERFGVWCGDGILLLVHEVGLNNDIVVNGAEFIKVKSIQTGTFLRKEQTKILTGI